MLAAVRLSSSSSSSSLLWRRMLSSSSSSSRAGIGMPMSMTMMMRPNHSHLRMVMARAPFQALPAAMNAMSVGGGLRWKSTTTTKKEGKETIQSLLKNEVQYEEDAIKESLQEQGGRSAVDNLKASGWEISHELGKESFVAQKKGANGEDIHIVSRFKLLEDDTYSEEYDEEEAEDDESGATLTFKALISKPGRGTLCYNCTFDGREIGVHSISHLKSAEVGLTQSMETDFQYSNTYEPDFFHLDAKLQGALEQVLEDHGVDVTLMNQFADSLAESESAEYKAWLQNLETFFQK